MGDPNDCLPVFYTLKEAALKLRLSVSTLYDFHHRGIITIKKNGKNNVILRVDVEKYIDSIDLTREPNRTKSALRKRREIKKAVAASKDAA